MTTTNPQENKTKKQEQQDRQEELNDICAVMDLPAGRRMVARILAKGRLYQTSFAGHSNQTVFNEGMRNMALWLFKDLDEACADQLLLMMKEHKDKENG